MSMKTLAAAVLDTHCSRGCRLAAYRCDDGDH
jgi:hypothetical protein